MHGGVANFARSTSGSGLMLMRSRGMVNERGAYVAGNAPRETQFGYRQNSQPKGFSYDIHQSRGKGRGETFMKPKVVCQGCGKSCLIALKCYHRFDVTFLGDEQFHLNQNSGGYGRISQINK